MDKEELVSEVLQKIENEVTSGDLTGVAQLIENLPKSVLEEYLYGRSDYSNIN